MNLAQITPLILTFNEAPNIPRTLGPLEWAHHIIIVDSFSTDGTGEIARAAHAGVRVVERVFDSFAGQCNFGLTQIETDWVLSLDADYVVTPEFVQEISALEPPSDVAGYCAQFRYCIFGRPLRSSLYPARTVLYRRQPAKYENEGHGHRVRVAGRIEPLVARILHDDRKPLERWLSEQNKYAAREAEHLLSVPRDQLNRSDRIRRQIVIAPAAVFLYTLIGKGLIFDGPIGWFYCFQRTIAEIILSLRLIEQMLTNASTHTP
jgi:glycosyltransferase involved in cell wall biosynthesis